MPTRAEDIRAAVEQGKTVTMFLTKEAVRLALPGYGFYLVSMPHSPQAPVIEAFSTWMRAIS